MKLINSNYEIIEPVDYSLENLYKFVELCGRVCYKSEDKITSDSATKFVNMLINSGHVSVLEHATVYLKIHLDSKCTNKFLQEYNYLFEIFKRNPYSVVGELSNDRGCKDMYITTNLRVLYENVLLDECKQYICDQPEDMHERRYTVRFVCDRGVSHEFVRHRVFSFSQESTRYCNYSKDKFGNELTFIKPYCIFGNIDEIDRDNIVFDMFLSQLELAEDAYMRLLEDGCKPQEARAVLPNATKTELVMTGFASDWQHFFLLRSNKYGRGGAHPDADKLATSLYENFISKNWINKINTDAK